MRAGRNGPFISHLMFVDDLLLFGKASISQIKCIQHGLTTFCDMSGQLVRVEKSNIYFSKCVDQDTRRKLVQLSCFKEVNVLGRYLGVPLLGKTPKCKDFQYLVEKVYQRLGLGLSTVVFGKSHNLS